jgi:hypothetical protein
MLLFGQGVVPLMQQSRKEWMSFVTSVFLGWMTKTNKESVHCLLLVFHAAT